ERRRPTPHERRKDQGTRRVFASCPDGGDKVVEPRVDGGRPVDVRALRGRRCQGPDCTKLCSYYTIAPWRLRRSSGPRSRGTRRRAATELRRVVTTATR